LIDLGTVQFLIDDEVTQNVGGKVIERETPETVPKAVFRLSADPV
jgi:hypothetical protein